MIEFIAEVEYFAQVSELKEAMHRIKDIATRTQSLVQRWIASTKSLGMLSVTRLRECLIEVLHTTGKAIYSAISKEDQNVVDDIRKSFEAFKERFDRGLMVQTAQASERLVKAVHELQTDITPLSMHTHLRVKPYLIYTV